MDQESGAPDSRSMVGDQLRAVRRRWRLVALVAVLAVAASLAYSLLRVPEYRSTADVLLSATAYDVQRVGAELTSEEMATQVQVATSRPVANLVRDDLRLAATPSLDDLVTVEALGSSRVLRFTARTSHPDEAAEIARSVASSYLTHRRTKTQQTLSGVTDALAERQQQLESALDRLAATPADPRARADVAAERRDLESQLGQITTQLASLDIPVTGGAGGELLNEPEENTSQSAPRPVVNGVLALLIGLLAGLALAVMRNRFDNVAHDEDNLVASLAPAQIVGRVPRWKAHSPEDRLITVSRPESHPSQAFQAVVARIRFLVRGVPEATGRGAILLCTSARADEGKTDVALNVAVAAAKVGMQVILVDADYRRSPGERPHGLPMSEVGLSDVLMSGRSVERSLVEGPVRGLSVLPAGAVPADPGGLVASTRMRPVLAALADQADLVIVDTSPNARYADALELAGLVDATVLVTRMGRSRLPMVRAAAERLQDVGAVNLAAVVLGSSSSASQRLPRTAPSALPAERATATGPVRSSTDRAQAHDVKSTRDRDEQGLEARPSPRR
jgi:capsular exopolysaccharide synthesis family protein